MDWVAMITPMPTKTKLVKSSGRIEADCKLDYLLEEYLGVDAELDFLGDLASGAYTLEPFTSQDIERCRELLSTYRDLKPGLADIAVVATAEKLEIDRILTLDERDFRVLRPKGGEPFTLLPADANR